MTFQDRLDLSDKAGAVGETARWLDESRQHVNKSVRPYK